MKNDNEARALYGPAYDSIPKSVFAVAAYHLADICSEAGADNGQAIARLREELEALSGQVIPPEQAERALRALAKAITSELLI